MVRSAYGIGDPSSWAKDCLYPIVCPCCTVNQLYQTTSRLGNPTTDGGFVFNQNPMMVETCKCSSCLHATFCMPCSLGTVLNKSVGMPHLMGCCCFNLFSARNILRYQYRLKPHSGSDVMEECFIPYMFYCVLGVCANSLICICPCVYPCLFPLFCGALVTVDMSMLQEAETKKGGENQAYLRGYSVPSASSPTAPQYVTYVNLPSSGPYQPIPAGVRVVPMVDYQQQQPQQVYGAMYTAPYAQSTDQPTYAQPIPQNYKA
jgi:hypothetical protein